MEERRRKSKRNASSHHDQRQIQGITHRRSSHAHEMTRALHDLIGRFGGRASGDRFNGQAGGLGLKAALGTTTAAPTTGFNNHVADVAGVTACAHRATRRLRTTPPPTPVDTVSAQKVLVPLGGAEPTFGERKRLGVEIAVHPQPGGVLESRPEAETRATLEC